MSDDQNTDSVSTTDQTIVDSNSQQDKDNFVNRSAYEEVSKDMHKYKSGLKVEQARANEAESKLKAIEESKLKDNQQWETLYNQTLKEKEELQNKSASEKERTDNLTRKAALKTELGGNIKDTYLDHANLKEIEFNEDGSLSPESVKAVANKFREDHSILIPTSDNTDITNPGADPTKTISSEKEKTLSDMSFEEKSAMLKNKK